MQYFERSRFEYNPDSSRPWKVDLTNVGSRLTEGATLPRRRSPGSAGENMPTTSRRGTAWAAFSTSSGGPAAGLAIFGYPISEELHENGMTVQYFERARFELTGQGRVQLGHLGAELLEHATSRRACRAQRPHRATAPAST